MQDRPSWFMRHFRYRVDAEFRAKANLRLKSFSSFYWHATPTTQIWMTPDQLSNVNLVVCINIYIYSHDFFWCPFQLRGEYFRHTISSFVYAKLGILKLSGAIPGSLKILGILGRKIHRSEVHGHRFLPGLPAFVRALRAWLKTQFDGFQAINLYESKTYWKLCLYHLLKMYPLSFGLSGVRIKFLRPLYGRILGTACNSVRHCQGM